MKFKFFTLLLILLLQIPAIAAELTFEEQKLKERLLNEFSDNYLGNVYYANGLIIRWNKAFMPIRIYAEDDEGVPYYYRLAFIRAVAIWNKELKNIVQVIFVDNEKESDIAFKVIKKTASSKEFNNAETNTMAYTEPVIKNNKLQRMNINVYERNFEGGLFKDYEVLNIAVHEFGHAMGIAGHSDNKNSIMYALFDPRDRRVENFLHKSDINTLQLLYFIEPDITNGNKTLEKGNVRGEVLTGTKEERINSSIKNLEKELEIMPNDSLACLKLALLYFDKNDETNFIKYMNEALVHAKTDDEIALISMEYAYFYYKKKDKKNAQKYIENALKYKTDNDILELKSYIDKLR